MATIFDFQLKQLDSRVFALSLPIRPGSIRDSLFRADRFCEGLVAAGMLAPGDNILVVGSGPTGMAVSVGLLHQHAFVVTCNLPPADPDEWLGTCSSRVVCPTTYDFPARQWPERHYPFDRTPATFRWEQGTAQDVYTGLLTSFNDLSEPYHKRDVYHHFEPAFLKKLRPTPGGVGVILEEGGLESDEVMVHLVVVCVGPGQHLARLRGSHGDLVGYGFWYDDDVTLSDPAAWAGRRVLVIGGGDGGIADFVRLFTGRMNPYDCLTYLDLPRGLVVGLAEVNRRMWQAFTEGQDDHTFLTAGHGAMDELIDDAWSHDTGLVGRARLLLLDPDRRPAVQLAFKCYHLDVSYFGNQVVAQLLARAVAERRDDVNAGLAPFRIGVRYADHRGLNGHRCQGKADECATSAHEIRFERGLCPDADGRPMAIPAYVAPSLSSSRAPDWKRTCDDDVTRQVPFDRVIPRFGAGGDRRFLPANVVAALDQKAVTEIRDVPEFYTR